MRELSHILNQIQTILPTLRDEFDPITERQERLIEVLEIVGVEAFVKVRAWGRGRPKADRQALARAFVLKAFYNMNTTVELVERLHGCRNLRRICGFERRTQVPDEATFSRAFKEFAESMLAEQVHASLIQQHRAERLVGHISRDSTEIEAREKPITKPKKILGPKQKPGRKLGQKKGHPAKGRPLTRLQRQQTMSLKDMIDDLPKNCDQGRKISAKRYPHFWTGYKLHIDTADGGVPISCLLTSASLSDSQVAMPLMQMTSQRVTSLYDLMDSAYDADVIHAQSRALGHVPIIKRHGRRNDTSMDPAYEKRFKLRNTSERVNARLKEEFGARKVRVKGHQKIMSHLMFGVVALTADQLMRLIQ